MFLQGVARKRGGIQRSTVHPIKTRHKLLILLSLTRKYSLFRGHVRRLIITVASDGLGERCKTLEACRLGRFGSKSPTCCSTDAKMIQKIMRNFLSWTLIVHHGCLLGRNKHTHKPICMARCRQKQCRMAQKAWLARQRVGSSRIRRHSLFKGRPKASEILLLICSTPRSFSPKWFDQNANEIEFPPFNLGWGK